MTIEGETVGGVYPDILRNLGEGCRFEFSIVPRARLELMFEAGQADLLMPASRTPRRDELGFFVPMVRSRPTLISMDKDRPALRSLDELLRRRELRVVLVRGFDYGEAYQGLAKELGTQGRLSQAVDATEVARMLSLGMADLTVMAPSIFTGALQNDARLKALVSRIRIEPVDELPWGESGVYLSKSALSAIDRNQLKDLIDKAGRNGEVWKAFQRYYPASVLAESFRPR
ncbi:transporter substrate-binding domain-containing protein [Pelomonas sp. SE-A7]|uniref:substrate-binding periplasmic protein n=1 Tax=Pelomonas sp. SE-A7 TaxID=3054953 RepID=UPI00259C9445|nr:transporter substrate-binding domain-containing protein [Pelomonas sp. SE-A7]MDM4764676.1 transporter substrate-binding domain-containing protein [Pelomonas sp. SE-A7]